MEDINSELNEQKRKVDFNSYDMSVKELISMVNDGLIDIAPEYQRQFRWDALRQSTLIESIFFGYSSTFIVHGNQSRRYMGSDRWCTKT